MSVDPTALAAAAPLRGELLRVELSTGTLTLAMRPSTWELERLATFTARPNPRRPFLVVSRLLGRYLPVRPAEAVAAQAALAACLPASLPGPVLVLGIAEAAVALAHGVLQAYARRTGRTDLYFVHTSRHALGPQALRFTEDHSHAPQHHLHLDGLRPHSVVVVDDERTTGRTLDNLAAQLPPCRLLHLVLADFSVVPDPRVRALLSASLDFEQTAVAALAPQAVGTSPVDPSTLRNQDGRRCRRGPVDFQAPPELLEGAAGQRVLVVGMGEHQVRPFLLARALEEAGARVEFQCTTRAPVPEGGCIRSVSRFDDALGEGIPEYLYNARPHRWDRVLVCPETRASRVDPALLGELRAELVHL